VSWSCSVKASEVLKRWTAACLKQTGIQNEYEFRGQRYLWEIARTEWEDGSVTGSICRILPDVKSVRGDPICRRVGSYHIKGNGIVSRAPGFLRKL
jgi:hypothetical protein